jgi:hypothetical protein
MSHTIRGASRLGEFRPRRREPRTVEEWSHFSGEYAVATENFRPAFVGLGEA